MSRPLFLLTGKTSLTLFRRSKGEYVDGEWVEGQDEEVPIIANVQPLKTYELLMYPEAERSRDWQKVYSASEMRTQVEGSHDADEFYWDSMQEGQMFRYKVMKVRRYKMGVLDHYMAHAVRIELTPN